MKGFTDMSAKLNEMLSFFGGRSLVFPGYRIDSLFIKLIFLSGPIIAIIFIFLSCMLYK